MEYPEYAEINGKTYKINTNYQTGIDCFRAIESTEITDYERPYAIIGLLFGEDTYFDFEDMQIAMEKAIKFLCCGKENNANSNQKKLMDFDYDKGKIIASFISDYQIDLDKVEYMHWWKFCDLIAGLTEKSILSRVIDLRNTNLSDYKDAKQREKIRKEMQKVALPQPKVEYTEEQKELLKKLGLLKN